MLGLLSINFLFFWMEPLKIPSISPLQFLVSSIRFYSCWADKSFCSVTGGLQFCCLFTLLHRQQWRLKIILPHSRLPSLVLHIAYLALGPTFRLECCLAHPPNCVWILILFQSHSCSGMLSRNSLCWYSSWTSSGLYLWHSLLTLSFWFQSMHWK